MIRYRYFLSNYKIANLILFNKPNKPPNSLNSLKPISLLPSYGKILEKIYAIKIIDSIEKNVKFKINQHGFTKGKSTISAAKEIIDKIRIVKKQNYICYLLLVDISGAFDNIKWLHILNNAIRYKLGNSILDYVNSILSDRKIILNNKTRYLNKGCPQRGVASPVLWNLVMLDLLHRLSLVYNTFSIAYADDLGILIYCKSESNFNIIKDKCINILESWCIKSGLKISAEKSQLLYISGKKISENFAIDNNIVKEYELVKYLGIVIDKKLNFNSYIFYINKKSHMIINALSVIFKKTYFTHLDKLFIYKNVVIPSLTYGYSLFYNEKRKTTRKQLRKIQRKFLIFISGAYNSTSNLKLYKLLNVLPLDLDLEIEFMSYKQTNKHLIKNKLQKQLIITQFLSSFFNSEECRNCSLNIDFRIDYNLFLQNLTPQLTQITTGHGPFGQYLFKRLKTTNRFCTHCPSELETSTHILYECKNRLLHSSIIDNLNDLNRLLCNIKDLMKHLHIKHQNLN